MPGLQGTGAWVPTQSTLPIPLGNQQFLSSFNHQFLSPAGVFV